MGLRRGEALGAFCPTNPDGSPNPLPLLRRGETDRRSFIVEAGLEIPLLHAVNYGLLKRVELAPVAIQRGEPTDYKYEVTDEGLDFVNRYIRGEDIS
jgi:hypothetical protein